MMDPQFFASVATHCPCGENAPSRPSHIINAVDFSELCKASTCRPYKWILGVAVAALVFLQGGPSMAEVIHVDADASSGGNGESWGQAYDDLQDAFSKPPSSGDEIWVADGTYKPGSSRTDAFNLVDDVSVYGGFAGDETSLADRDVEANVTILSGDIGPGHADSYHIVKAGSSVTGTAILDGFTIEFGYADGGQANNNGAGIFVSGGDPKILNCVIKSNTATNGGGVYITAGGAPELVNTICKANDASFGAGVYSNSGKGKITNCTIASNHATTAGGGGGIYIANGSLVIRNSIITGNTTGSFLVEFGERAQIKYGGGRGSVKYCWIDVCLTSAGGFCEFTRDHNIGVSGPVQFVLNEFSLGCNSPCIDAGDNNSISEAADRAGSLRKIDNIWALDTGAGTVPIVDIGAYEVQAGVIYVDADASSGFDGKSWGTAYDDLQDAFDDADTSVNCAEIWVADGIYKPSVTNPSSTNNREETFLLPSGVAMFGGFKGDETNRAECTGGTDPCLDDNDCSGTCDDVRARHTCDGGADDGGPCTVDANCAGVGKCVVSILSGDLNGDDAISESDCGIEDDGEWNSGESYCERIFFDTGGLSRSNCENIFGETWNSSELKCQFNTGIVLTNNDDNSFHVVTADSSSANAVIDGFTITAGNADRKGICDSASSNEGDVCDDDTDCTGGTCKPLHNQGGGLQLRDVSSAVVIDNDITVRNCTFSGNVATDHGTGFNDHGVDSVITKCIFDRNYSDTKGAGLYIHDSASPTATDCRFSFNTSRMAGGALYIENAAVNGNPTFTNCVFRHNTSQVGEGGGGVWVDGNTITFKNCLFQKNRVALDDLGNGGGLYIANDESIVDGCIFVENLSTEYGGGFGSAGDENVGIVKNSIFIRNKAPIGAGLANKGGFPPDIANCKFVGNVILNTGFQFQLGAGLYLNGSDEARGVANSLFVGNNVLGGIGSAVNVAGNNEGDFFDNCTIVDNVGFHTTAINLELGSGHFLTLRNSIVQRNLRLVFSCTAGQCDGGVNDGQSCTIATDCVGWADDSIGPRDIRITYTNVAGDSGTGNIDESPDDIFVAAIENNWEFDSALEDSASYDAETHETTFTDTSKSASEWDHDELEGLVFHLLHEDGAADYSIITRSSGKTFTVWGDLTDAFDTLADDDPYAFLDYHYVDCAEGIDAGSNSALANDITDLDNDGDTSEDLPFDLDGNTRKVDDAGGVPSDATVDMGAFEKQTSSSRCP